MNDLFLVGAIFIIFLIFCGILYFRDDDENDMDKRPDPDKNAPEHDTMEEED